LFGTLSIFFSLGHAKGLRVFVLRQRKNSIQHAFGRLRRSLRIYMEAQTLSRVLQAKLLHWTHINPNLQRRQGGLCPRCREAAPLARAYVANWREQLKQRLHMSGVAIEYLIVRHRRRRRRRHPARESQTLHDKVLTSLGCRDVGQALRRYPPALLGERGRWTSVGG
jgi:hypothetical protein